MTLIPLAGPNDNVIRVLLGGDTVALDVTTLCSVKGDLTAHMKRFPGDFSWLLRVREAAHTEVSKRELAYKLWCATFYQDCLNDNPKLAEWKAKAAMVADSDHLKVKNALIEVQDLARRLDGAVRAMDAKGHMLRSIGAMSRAEMSHLNIDTREPNVDDVEKRLRERLSSESG